MTDQGSGGGRLEEFEAEVATLRIRGGSAERERQATTAGLALAVIGIVVAVIALIVSGTTENTLVAFTSISAGLLGLVLTVAGSVLWFRYSLTRYLRYWMLRLIYEERQRPAS